MSRGDARLGLRRGVVLLASHDPRWAAAFESERVRLHEALTQIACSIEHIGSTSVAGLIAKPIVDIAIAVERANPLSVREPLEGIGYEYRGDGGDDGGWLFVRESGPSVRTHHVHVVGGGDPQYARWLALRDLMRGDAAARDRYAAAKRELAERHPDDRPAYTEGKTGIIRALLSAAGD